eukprot:g44595.t1
MYSDPLLPTLSSPTNRLRLGTRGLIGLALATAFSALAARQYHFFSGNKTHQPFAPKEGMDAVLVRPPSKGARVVVVGSSNMDLVTYVDKFPQPKETISGKEFATFLGGKGANQAVAIALLGGNISFIAKTGDDAFGKTMREKFEGYGMDITGLLTARVVSSGVAAITVDGKGENHIIVVPGANSLLTPAEVREAKRIVASAQVLVCQNEIPIETTTAALSLGKQLGLTTIFNAAPAPAVKSVPLALYAATDILCVNEVELEALSGIPVKNMAEIRAGSKKLLDKGVGTVVVTMGDKGSFALNHTAEWTQPSVVLPAHKVVDTVGAGDAFTGSLAYFLSQAIPLPEAMRRANNIAAMSIQKKGAQASYPTRKEVEKYDASLLKPWSSAL